MPDSEDSRVYVSDLCLVIKHQNKWKKFCDRLNYRKGVSLKKLEAIGDLNIDNLQKQGRDSFYPSEAQEAIKKATGSEGAYFKRQIKSLDKILKDFGIDESFIEGTENPNEYRFRIFAAKGTATTDKIIPFFSKTYGFKQLASQRGVKLETSRLMKDVFKYIGELEKKIEKITKEPEEIHIKLLEDFLDRKKQKYKETRPFRTFGSMWVDFEEREYISERDEVDQILGRFKNGECIVVIKGKPASGKSVVLRNVGFKLINNNKNVYYIGLKKEPPSIKEVKKLKNCSLLIDDAHLEKQFVSDVIEEVTDIKILIATRDIEDKLGGEIHGRLKDLIEKGVPIHARDAVEDIIELFEKNVKKITPEAKKKLEEYKNNLWLVIWALDTYKTDNTVDKDKILKRIKEWMDIDLKEDYGIKNASYILFILSVFYRYEIKVKKEFLDFVFYEYDTENIRLPKDLENFRKDIDKLIKINELLVGDGNLGLHHSVLAELYYQSGKKYFEDKFSEEDLFYLSLKKYPKRRMEIMLDLCRVADSNLNENSDSKKLVGNLIVRDLEIFKEWMNLEENFLLVVTSFVILMNRTKEDISEEFIDLLTTKIKKGNQTALSCWSIQYIRSNNVIFGNRLMGLVPDLIKNETNIREIGKGVGWISISNLKFAIGLLPMIAEKIGNERGQLENYKFLSEIFQRNPLFWKEVTKQNISKEPEK